MKNLEYYLDAEEELVKSIEQGGPEPMLSELHRALGFARRRIAVLLVMAGLLTTTGCFEHVGKALGGLVESAGEVVTAVGTEIVAVTEATTK